jgi:hypothetical protein
MMRVSPAQADPGGIMRLLTAVVTSAFAAAVVFAATGSNALTTCETTTDAVDQTINICDTVVDRTVNDDNTTADGTVFVAEANPSVPSTGTGVFEPFLRTQEPSNKKADGFELGFSTDTGEPDINFDTKNGSSWTKAIQVGDLSAVTTLDFALDANQNGPVGSAANLIFLTDVQIYIESDPIFATPEVSGIGVDGTGYTGTIFDNSDNSLLGVGPRWSLDNADNGNVTVVLEAAICGEADTIPGQCGSGHGDMVMSILLSEINLTGVSATDYLVFYTEFRLGNDGFEEWKRAPGVPIPEPNSALLFAIGGTMVGGSIRRFNRSSRA